jgi:hypothetical protein
LKISEKHNGVSIGAFQFLLYIFGYNFFCVVAKSSQEDLVRFGLPSLENVKKSGDFSYILVELWLLRISKKV